MAALRARSTTRLFKRDAIEFVQKLEAGVYDLALADPPYGSRKLDRIVERWLEVPFSPVLSVEHGRDHPLPSYGTSLDFGDTRVTIFRSASSR